MTREVVFTVERLAFGGEGVGHANGKVVFVPFTAPGDRVRVEVTAEHERYDRAVLREVLEPSPHRTAPRCSVFGRCGGCQWQHLDYAAQLTAKEEILRDTLERIGRISSPEILPMIPASEPWNYRNRIQLQVGKTGEIGFHALGSHDVVAFEQCEIADERLNAQVRALRNNGKHPSEKFELTLETDSRRFFSQVNPAQGMLLRQTVIDSVWGRAEEAFTRKWNLLELYCGAGNFTLPLAERVGQLIAVDENGEAVASAEREAIRLGLENIEFIAGDVEWGLKKIYRRKGLVDVLILDPPRAGAKEVVDLILLVAPRRIVYVSCDPATLARDLKILLHRQYRLEAVQPIDLFPQTYHIESVARLTRVVEKPTSP